MQFNCNWLREFINLDIKIEDLCDQLTMAGLEVDNYEKVSLPGKDEDYIIQLDLTPNRSDCFSIRGIARELSISNNILFKEPKIRSLQPNFTSSRKIKIIKEAPSYFGRTIESINNIWKELNLVQERLQLSGFKLINPIVDITNYVLLETGQPLHAFDDAKINGDIEVRFARNKENIVLLDESKITLKDDCLIIADQSGPIALAGIMGGLSTAVDETTTSIFLESAFFLPDIIRGKARRYGIQTDASIRFERGVDFKLQKYALERASDLLSSYLGGNYGTIQDELKKINLPKLKQVSLNLDKSNKFLGTNITKTKAKKYLKGLGCEINEEKDLLIKSPSWRFDLEIYHDFVEELARLEGYNNIPDQSISLTSLNTFQRDYLQDIKTYLVNKGYSELVTYSFVDPKKANILDNTADLIVLENPISENMSVMRSSLLSSFIETFLYNKNRGKETIRNFEMGSIYKKESKGVIQENVLGILIGGNSRKVAWNSQNSGVDFYELKGEIENIYQITNQQVEFKKLEVKGLHPGKTSSIYLSSNPSEQIGYLGAIDPSIADKIGLKDEIIFAQLSCKYFSKTKETNYKNFSRYPASQRDLSFLVDKDTLSQDIVKLIKQKSNKYEVDILTFDIYEGARIESGLKSISYEVKWKSKKGTLNDAEIDKIVSNIINASEKRSWKIRK